jgi:ubiquitin carboxyl-terminal hydrolase 5/13
MSKVARGLLSARYAPPLSLDEGGNSTVIAQERYAVAPRMFKHLVGKGHREFSSGKQQDASEYFQYLLSQVQRAERVALTSRMRAPANTIDTPSIFFFELEQRYECQVTGQVKYVSGQQTCQNIWELSIPLDAAINTDEVEGHRERKRKREEMLCTEAPVGSIGQTLRKQVDDEEPKLVVPFQACIDKFFSPELVEYRNPSLRASPSSPSPLVPAKRTCSFKNFPRYIMVKLGRYYVDATWTMRKIDAEVPVPDSIDLSPYASGGGMQQGEVPIPEDGAAPSPSPSQAAGSGEVVTPNEEIVAQLMSMGFSENGCRRAAIATQNVNADVAMEWVLEHMEDQDSNDPPAPSLPPPSTGGEAYDEESLAILSSFGYSELQCKASLKATGGSVERYVP